MEALQELFFADNHSDASSLEFVVNVRSFYQLGVLDFDAEVDVVIREAENVKAASPALRNLLASRGGESFHMRAYVNTAAVRFLLDGSEVKALDDVQALLQQDVSYQHPSGDVLATNGKFLTQIEKAGKL